MSDEAPYIVEHEIATPDDFVAAGEVLAQAKAARRRVVDHFAPMKKAMNDARKALLEQEKAVLGRIDGSIGEISARMAAYERRAKTEADAQQDALDADLGDDAPLVPRSAPDLPDGLNRRTNWTWDLVDLDAVRPEFFKLDTGKVGRAVRRHGEGAEAVVGGIRVSKRTTYASSG